MAYFSRKQDRIERGGKVVADIFCAGLFATFSVAFFGWQGGLEAFVLLESALFGLDYVLADGDDVPGVVR
jgi:hypothetical protein